MLGVVEALSVYDVDDAAGVEYVEDGVVEAEGALVFCVAVVLLGEGEHLDLNMGTLTTRRITQLMITTIREMRRPLSMREMLPFYSPSIR